MDEDTPFSDEDRHLWMVLHRWYATHNPSSQAMTDRGHGNPLLVFADNTL